MLINTIVRPTFHFFNNTWLMTAKNLTKKENIFFITKQIIINQLFLFI